MEELNKLKQSIALGLFGDTYNNVNILLTQVINAYDKGLIEKKPEYKELATIYSALKSNNVSVLKNLRRYKGQNFEGVLYDAYKEALYASFEMIKSECYSTADGFADEKLSKQAGVRVFNVKKLPKKLLINVSRASRDSSIRPAELEKYLDMYVGVRENRGIEQDFKSLSFVDNSDIRAYRDINDFVTFVYPPNIPNELLITITRKDAWVKFKDKRVYTPIAPFISTPRTLLDSTNEFNEVAVLRKGPHSGVEVKPMAVFASRRITDVEIQIAKSLNIPIIYSETVFTPKKYTTKRKLDYSYLKDRKEEKFDFDELTL